MLKIQQIKPLIICTHLLTTWLIGSETLTHPFAFTLGMGFEETSTKWSNLDCSQNYEHIKFLLFQAAGSSLNRNVLFMFGGDYGIFGKGELEETKVSSTLFFPTQGVLADAFFTLGYLITLTPDRPTITTLIPQAGYSGYWLHLSTSPTHFKEQWYGPFLGGSLDIMTNQGVVVSLLYHYHWLTLHHTLTHNHSSPTKLKFHHAYGHEAELKLQTYLFQKIRLGASLHYFYYRKAHPTSYSAQREDLSISLQYIYDF